MYSFTAYKGSKYILDSGYLTFGSAVRGALNHQKEGYKVDHIYLDNRVVSEVDNLTSLLTK